MDEINVVCLDMPTTIKAYTIRNTDNTFTVVLNARQCHEQQLQAYYHEIRHLQNNDYAASDSVNRIEIFAHEKSVETAPGPDRPPSLFQHL